MGKPANAALTANGITVLEQLAGYTEKDLLAMHGVGPKAIRILKAELQNLGLSLKN